MKSSKFSNVSFTIAYVYLRNNNNKKIKSLLHERLKKFLKVRNTANHLSSKEYVKTVGQQKEVC